MMQRGTLVFILLLAGSGAASSPSWALNLTLGPSTGTQRVSFGTSLAISATGELLAVGGVPEAFMRPGRVEVLSGLEMWKSETLTAENTGRNDRFGFALAIDQDGDVLVVGDPFHDEAHLFIRKGDMFDLDQTFAAASTEAGDQFGCAVAISPNGRTIVVGAFNASNAGAAYVFSLNVTTKGGVLQEQGVLQASPSEIGGQLGYSVSVPDANSVYVGAPGTSRGDDIGGTTLRCGAVYAFKVNTSNASDETWQQVLDFGSPHSVADGSFGVAVSAFRRESEENHTVAVGATYEGNRKGGVSIFSVTLSPVASATSSGYLEDPEGAQDDLFGAAVSFIDGVCVCGAPGQSRNGTGVDPNDMISPDSDQSGAVYVFSESSSWGLTSYIKAPNTTSGDLFGRSIAISSDGAVLAIGAPRASSGAGRVFTYSALPPDATQSPTSTPTSNPSPSPTSTPTSNPTPSPTEQVFAITSLQNLPQATTIATTIATTGVTTIATTSAPTRSNLTTLLGTTTSRTGTTTRAPTFAPTAAPTLGPSYEGNTTITGNSTVARPITIVQGTLSVTGDLSLVQGSNVTLVDSTIVATGDVVVSGPLVLQLASAPMDGDVIQLVSGSSVTGQFSDITLESEELLPCQRVVLTQQSSPTALSALASVDNSQCEEPPLSPGAIAGIAVGVVLIALLAVLLIVAYQRKKKADITKKFNAEIREKDMNELARAHG